MGNLSSFVTKSQKDGAIYDVSGVANHHGDYTSGHYTAACRVGSASNGSWHLFDDSEVTELKDSRSVVTQQTYVVFLVRSGEDAATLANPSLRRQSIAKSMQSGGPPLQRRKTLLRRQSTSKPDDWPHAMSPALKARDAATSLGLGPSASPPISPAKSPKPQKVAKVTPDASPAPSAAPASASPPAVAGTHWICPQCEEANKAVRTQCQNCNGKKPPTAVFEVGQKVQRRDDSEEWGTGYVTSIDPLLVTVKSNGGFDPKANGHEWYQVREIQKEPGEELPPLQLPMASPARTGKLMLRRPATAVSSQGDADGIAKGAEEPKAKRQCTMKEFLSNKQGGIETDPAKDEALPNSGQDTTEPMGRARVARAS